MHNNIVKAMVRKVGLLILFSLLFSPAIFATDNMLSLEEAQVLARENNPSLRLLELEYEEKGYTVSVIGKAHDDSRREIYNINWGLQQLASREAQLRQELRESDDLYKPIYQQELELVSQQASSLKEAMDKIVDSRYDLRYQYELEKAAREEIRHRREDFYRILDREVEAKYYTILQLDRTQASLQDSLEYLGRLQDSENKKVSLGLSTPLEVKAIGARAENTGHLLRTTTTLRRLVRQDFNRLLGRPLDQPLYLDPDLSPGEELVPHPGCGTVYLTNSRGLQSIRAYLETEKNRVADLLDRYSSGTPEYLAAKKRLEMLELKLEEAEQGFLMGINNAYNLVQEARAHLRSQEAKNNLAQDELHIGFIKKDLGLIGVLDLLELEQMARQTKNKQLEAIAAYKLAVTDYDLAREGIIVGKPSL